MRNGRPWSLAPWAAGVAVAVLVACAARDPEMRQLDAADAERSQAAFEQVARVLRHPRCLNCHPSGDVPRVGEEAKLHPQNVQRGPHGVGATGLSCGTCHQDANQDLVGLPGAPHWSLAPRSMGWEGLDDEQLARTLVDREKNGDRSLEDLLEHVSHDPLVGWAWSPGAGRSAPPVSQADFVQALTDWIELGAVPPTRAR